MARYARPSVTVDLAIFTVLDSDLKVLLVERAEPPFAGAWALPGGFVRVGDAFDDQGESLEDAARRELVEETHLELQHAWLEQVGAFGDPGRDPRMRIISVAYTALVRPTLAPLVRGGSDAAQARWVSLTELPDLAFDHAAILERARKHLAGRLADSGIAFELVPETFTVAELRAVWTAILGADLDPGNFRRRFRRLVDDGVVEEAPGRRVTPTKPAAVWRFVGDRHG
ncbi:MAG: NUDIX hydrolase [Myxococcales bacterium]|nr:NUDIX hydrolase [Myxococcales bacterium]